MEPNDTLLMSVANAAYLLSHNNTPMCSAIWHRMQNPRPGELVMEYSRAVHYGDPHGFGRLVGCDRDEGTGEIVCFDGTRQRWDNAAFAVIPTRQLLSEVIK